MTVNPNSIKMVRPGGRPRRVPNRKYNSGQTYSRREVQHRPVEPGLLLWGWAPPTTLPRKTQMQLPSSLRDEDSTEKAVFGQTPSRRKVQHRPVEPGVLWGHFGSRAIIAGVLALCFVVALTLRRCRAPHGVMGADGPRLIPRLLGTMSRRNASCQLRGSRRCGA